MADERPPNQGAIRALVWLIQEVSYLFTNKFAILNYMKLIVGLGNPGKQYVGTRHNTGFALVDEIISSQGHSFKDTPKHHAQTAEVMVGSEKVLFIKPTTFYNESGQAVRAVSDFYKINPSDILVIHDELALPFGTIRSRVGGSDAGNNGIKSVSAHLGVSYGRIRVGIYNELRDRLDDADFVLSKFSSTERAMFGNIVDEVKQEVLKFITEDDFGATTKRLK